MCMTQMACQYAHAPRIGCTRCETILFAAQSVWVWAAAVWPVDSTIQVT